MTSVCLPEAKSKQSDGTLEVLGRNMAEISDACPVGIVLTFVYGAHAGTLKALAEHTPEVASFFEGKRMQDFRLRTRFLQRSVSADSDPIQLFLTLVRLCFGEIDQRCHFESSVEQSSFGLTNYSSRVYFDVVMHHRVLFDEEAFQESLLASGSMNERLLFSPLNLVFRFMADNDGLDETYYEPGRRRKRYL